MLLLDGIILGLIAGFATRGRLGNLAHAKLKGEFVILGVLLFQLSVPRFTVLLGLTGSLPLILWLVSMATLVALALVNWRSAGMALAALGILLNILAIGFNGAMPVSPEEIARLYPGVTPRFDLLHEPVNEQTRLTGLTDVIAIPGPPWHKGIASLGDFFLTIGAGLYVFVGMHEESSDV
ncbi:MAG: DUF5317 family protein [Actinomycetota bacterium]|nr:MAG: hypothetical protein FD171_629 [Actinomycetota bacterium]MDO8948893.1 DUF5317 family protein [Actinomycetota bacterium]MDP3630005.1 DUF5317 family protein [Actinomycetota bacterium]